MVGQSLVIMACWLWESIAWVAPSKHPISCTQPHQQKIPRSEIARILRDHQHRSVKTRAGNVRAGRGDLQTSALPSPCLPRCLGRRLAESTSGNHASSGSPGGRAWPRAALGELGEVESDAVIPPWWGYFPTPHRLLPPLGSSCSSSEGKGWRGLVAFANTVNKMLILCLAVVSLSLVTCSYRSRCWKCHRELELMNSDVKVFIFKAFCSLVRLWPNV